MGVLLVIGWGLFPFEYIEGEFINRSNKVESNILFFGQMELEHDILLVPVHQVGEGHAVLQLRVLSIFLHYRNSELALVKGVHCYYQGPFLLRLVNKRMVRVSRSLVAGFVRHFALLFSRSVQQNVVGVHYDLVALLLLHLLLQIYGRVFVNSLTEGFVDGELNDLLCVLFLGLAHVNRAIKIF